MSQKHCAKLSLQHLPDQSESSFQIPFVDTSDLLANDDDDFFRGSDDSLSTPMPQRTTHEPLTLSQLTPTPQHLRASTSAEQSTRPLKVYKTEPIKDYIGGTPLQDVKPRLTVPAIPSFENLKKEVNNLFTDSGHSHPVKVTIVTDERSHSPSVTGTSKLPKDTTEVTRASLSRPTEAILHSAEIDALPCPDPDQSYANTSFGSIANDGVAERLLVYSQKFMPTLELFNSEQPSLSETPAQVSSADPQISFHGPLTLSQVSPRKPSPMGLVDSKNGQNPTSPMRPSSKRPVSRTTTSSHQSKKGKVISDPPPVLQPSSIQNTGASVGAHYNGLKPMAETSRRAEHNRKGKEREVSRSAGSNSQGAHCRRKGKEVPREIKLDTEAISATSQRSEPVKSTTLRSTWFTRPVGFDLQLKSRLNSGTAESEAKVVSRKGLAAALPVPDFKALHAAHEAQLASRKEQITPIYPVPIELNTESRAKERERFDELVREKERETERALEQRKKEKEAEEEREIRELRKKAVPKAHEVPEWYKEAPRRQRGV